MDFTDDLVHLTLSTMKPKGNINLSNILFFSTLSEFVYIMDKQIVECSITKRNMAKNLYVLK